MFSTSGSADTAGSPAPQSGESPVSRKGLVLMTNVLVSTIPTFAGLAQVVSAAELAFEADAVAGSAYFGHTEFGVVAVDEAGRATLADVLAGKVISW